jgi:predicted alpha/beta hydrolase family esterase
MNKVAIIHGTKGTPESNWIPWLASSLKKLELEVFVPTMPTPEGQSLDSWLNAFREQVGSIDSSTTIIGHSVGAVFLLRLLEELTIPINCAAFVAGFTGKLDLPEYDTLNASFVKGPFHWKNIRKNTREVLCFSGDNDPYVPLTQGLEIAGRLGVKPYVISGGGHLNGEFGYSSFPLLLEKLMNSGISGKITKTPSGTSSVSE